MGLCKCGCGSETNGKNIYIHGHNRRNVSSYTTNGRWSIRYAACVRCGTTETKHYGRGLCIKCYRHLIYELKKFGFFEKWSEHYECCVVCGRIDRPHKAHGLCGTCYINKLNRKKGKPKRNFGAWSWYHKKCVKCGTTERPHVKEGLCYDCYEESKRNLSENSIICPVCGIKVNNLSQHLSMRAKKCEEHQQYQYDRLKLCFDSELTMVDLSKELDMDRHSITRLFIKYFGKGATDQRNEKTRRWCISKAAKINFNYKNMYGTVIYHSSPNQGIIRMRSKIEGIYADSLDQANQDWWYEKDHFHYVDSEGVKRTYTPDFYISNENKYIEVKGRNLLKANALDKIELVRNQNAIKIEIIQI